MGIVTYFKDEYGQKVYDVERALAASGWGIRRDNLEAAAGLRLRDRNNPGYRVTVLGIEEMPLYGTIYVRFDKGGWLILDNAIEQFELEEGSD